MRSLYWNETINSEIESVMNNHIQKLVDLPFESKLLGYKWIFKRKMKEDGSIDKQKPRPVVKSFRQQESMNYFDTYLYVPIITSIQTLIAIATINKLEMHQIDVKITLLNGNLDEKVYMEKFQGFVVNGQEKKVCKLVKLLYGLKEAPI